jgi:C1A family cysteine protease
VAKHIYNLRPSIPDHRDFLFSAPIGTALPTSADLGSAIPPIKDQGQEGSCTGFSLSSAREVVAKEHGNYVPFSPAFIYYEERLKEHTQNQDSGAYIRDGLSVLRAMGVCPETDFPYVVGGYATAPPQQAMIDAHEYRITSYSRLPGLSALKYAIVNKHPAVLGIAVYQSFEAVGADGKVPMPAAGEELLGGHAILVVGYHNDAHAPGGGWLTLNNSWGKGEGKHGQFFLPYAYATNAQYTFEMWTLS